MEEMIAGCTQMMSQMSGMMGGMMGGNMMGGSASGGSLLWPWVSPWYWMGWVLVLGLAVFLIISVVWTIKLARRPSSKPDSPLTILQRRFARGEIGPDQFETIKRQLA